MSVVNNILVGPINLVEAYNYMGAVLTNNTYDIYTLALSGLINKWSKHKFIRYDKPSALSELEFAGTINDRANGIFYGLKLANVGGRIETMHEATFEYQRLRLGTDWARLTDLNGYDKNAKPNPIGTLPEIIHVDVAPAHGIIDINYDTYNTTGVNIADVIASMSTSGADLKNFYPCVLVTGFASRLGVERVNSHWSEGNVTCKGVTPQQPYEPAKTQLYGHTFDGTGDTSD